MNANHPQGDTFDMYVAVDWSGARGPRLHGLQVACAVPGDEPPILCPSPGGGAWTRSAFLGWLSGIARSGRRTLVGLDFAFALPRSDKGAYFPGLAGGPSSPRALWRLVDDICVADPELYAGRFVRHPQYGSHFQGGVQYRRHGARLRTTDRACGATGLGHPASVFNLVGPTQVALGSLAGMRLLHALSEGQPGIAVWPFDRIPDPTNGLVLVEIFPRAFIRSSGGGRTKVTDRDRLAATLERFGTSLSHGVELPVRSIADRADALVSVAALRRIARSGRVLRAVGAARAGRSGEGWIFGVAA